MLLLLYALPLLKLIIYGVAQTSVLAEEAIVAVCTGENHVHPDAHRFGRRRRQMVGSVEGFHAKRGHFLVAVVDVDVVDRLEMNHAFQFAFALVHEVHEGAARSIEHEPPLFPPSTGTAQFVEVSSTTVTVDGDVLRANFELVAAT